jgi:hypothetical protein
MQQQNRRTIADHLPKFEMSALERALPGSLHGMTETCSGVSEVSETSFHPSAFSYGCAWHGPCSTETANAGLLPIRLVFGALMVGHGAQKLFGWLGAYGIEGTGQFFEGIGFRPGRTCAALAEFARDYAARGE